MDKDFEVYVNRKDEVGWWCYVEEGLGNIWWCWVEERLGEMRGGRERRGEWEGHL